MTKTDIAYYTKVESIAHKKGINADDFQTFILDLLLNIPKASVFLMDNAKIHHVNKLQTLWDIIKQSHRVDIRYFPPYSPFINPIGYIFHMFKQSVEQENSQDKESLKRSIDTFISTTNPQKATSCFMYVIKYYP